MTKLTLPLAAGRKYIRRNGRTTVPFKISSNGEVWCGSGADVNAETGRVLNFIGDHQHDIVADYIEPTQGATAMNQPIPSYQKLIDSVRRELAEAEGYRDAFYEIAKMLDMGVMSVNPQGVWVNHMRPKLQMKLDNAARMNRALNQAGAALDLNVGDDVTTMLVPAIAKLKAHAAELSKATPPAGQTFTPSQLEEAFMFAQSHALDYFKKDLAIK